MIKRLYILQLVVLLAIFIYNSYSYEAVYSSIIVLSVISLMMFLLSSTNINTFGDSQLAGICITTLASFSNLGNNGWVQQKITGIFGYYPSVIAGFVIATIVALCFDWIVSWI